MVNSRAQTQRQAITVFESEDDEKMVEILEYAQEWAKSNIFVVHFNDLFNLKDSQFQVTQIHHREFGCCGYKPVQKFSQTSLQRSANISF